MVAGTKTWVEVPTSRNIAVKAVFTGRVESGTITAEKYTKITRETYEA